MTCRFYWVFNSSLPQLTWDKRLCCWCCSCGLTFFFSYQFGCSLSIILQPREWGFEKEKPHENTQFGITTPTPSLFYPLRIFWLVSLQFGAPIELWLWLLTYSLVWSPTCPPLRYHVCHSNKDYCDKIFKIYLAAYKSCKHQCSKWSNSTHTHTHTGSRPALSHSLNMQTYKSILNLPQLT
jgi:hypothetical protein